MPIYGMTTTKSALSGLPRLGKLRKGAAREQGKAPRDLTYFRMTFDKEYEYLAPVWQRMYGGAPEFFDPVYVAGSTADEVFSFYLEDWTATTLLRRCDGLEQIRHYEPERDAWSDEPIVCQKLCGAACACKQVGRLNLIFLEFMRETGALGYITVETHAKNDIVTMDERLKAYERLFGSLDGVQFKFGRAPYEISRPRDPKSGKRGRMTKSLFYLYTSEQYTKNEVFGLMAGARPAALLPAPEPITPERLEAQKNRLGNGGDRRLVKPEPSKGAPLPDTDALADDVSEGEYSESDAPALKGPPWSQPDINTFVKKCHDESLSDKEALAALGVARLKDWPGSLQEAYAAVNAWIQSQQEQTA